MNKVATIIESFSYMTVFWNLKRFMEVIIYGTEVHSWLGHSLFYFFLYSVSSSGTMLDTAGCGAKLAAGSHSIFQTKPELQFKLTRLLVEYCRKQYFGNINLACSLDVARAFDSNSVIYENRERDGSYSDSS